MAARVHGMRTSAFVEATGLVLEDIGADRVTGRLEVTEAQHTPWGVAHGGLWATVVESAASVGASTAVREQGMYAVGLTNTTHFVRAVSSGSVRVEARALNQGRTQQLWQVDIVDERGKLVAHGELRLQNVPLPE
jgi:1,4-dihydroxy-2-naphthoyl-CoA hydrolase